MKTTIIPQIPTFQNSVQKKNEEEKDPNKEQKQGKSKSKSKSKSKTNKKGQRKERKKEEQKKMSKTAKQDNSDFYRYYKAQELLRVATFEQMYEVRKQTRNSH